MKNKTVMMGLVIFLLMIVSASGFEFDNIKQSEDIGKDYPMITIKNAFGFGDTLWTGKLNQNTDTCGLYCSAEKEITIYERGALIEDIKFGMLKQNGEREDENIRSYQLYINESVLIDVYGDKCDPTIILSNGSKSTNCYGANVGKEIRDKWVEYNLGEELPAGTYKVKLEGTKNRYENVDWIIKSNGKWIDEWAVWGNITAGDGAEVILVSPSNNSILESPQNFTCNATITGGPSIVNVSFWHNASGTWVFNQSTTYSTGDQLNERYQTGDVHSTDVKNNQWIAQAFTIGTTGANRTINVSKIGMKIDQGSDSAALMQISIRLVGIDGKPTGTDWATNNTIALSALPNNATGEWFNVTLNQTITLTNNQSYAIVATTNSLDFFNWRDDNTDATYAGGNYSQSVDGGSWSSVSSIDMMFEIFETGGILSTSDNFTLDVESGFIWNCQGCDSDGDCGFAPQNWTVTLAKNPPNITLLAPPPIISYHTSGTNLTLNWTVVDTNLDSCWLSYDPGINRSITCSLNTTQFNVTDSNNRNITFWANDTTGVTSVASTLWTYLVFNEEETYNQQTIEGSVETFTINLTVNSTSTIAAQNFTYNKSISAPDVNAVTDTNLLMSSSITIPGVNSDINKTFFWTFEINDTLVNSTFINQTIQNLNVDNCTANTIPILNFTVVDEELQTGLFASIETAVNIFNSDNSVLVANYSRAANSTGMTICANSVFTSDTIFRLYTVVKYQAEGYATEYYNILNSSLNNNSLGQNITLFDLNATDFTPFRFTFTGDTFLPVPGALVFLERQYIAENVFKTVELPLTDPNGQAILHLVRNDVIYNIRFVDESGLVLGTFQQVTAFCEDPLLQNCQISLSAVSNISATFTYDQLTGLSFPSAPVFNFDTNLVTFDFVVPSGAAKTVFMNVTRNDVFGNRTICETTLISASGTLSCPVDPGISDTSLSTVVTVDGKTVLISALDIDADSLGSIGYVAWFVLTLVLIFTIGDTKNGVLVALFIGYVGAVVLGFSRGTLIGTGAAGTWLLIITVLGVWRLNRNKTQ